MTRIPRFPALLLAALLAACSPAPPPEPPAPPTDPTSEPWYAQTVAEIAANAKEAARLNRRGDSQRASSLILQTQPLVSRALQVPKPTLAAMEAASDLDDLYGRMLLANKHSVWARQMFQKNVARWKNWQPQTANTARRLKIAQDAIEECDRLP